MRRRMFCVSVWVSLLGMPWVVAGHCFSSKHWACLVSSHMSAHVRRLQSTFFKYQRISMCTFFAVRRAVLCFDSQVKVVIWKCSRGLCLSCMKCGSVDNHACSDVPLHLKAPGKIQLQQLYLVARSFHILPQFEPSGHHFLCSLDCLAPSCELMITFHHIL